MRKLATLERILEINPIEGADVIVRATVKGWNVVTQLSNNFKPGDLVFYAEVDSFFPVIDKFEFLRKSSYRKQVDGSEGFRIRTIKLKNQISQGLILPLSEIIDFIPAGTELEEGLDVSEFVGITKYDDAIATELSGIAKGNFPSRIHKTDENRVQNCSRILNKYKGTEAYVAEKVDGSSMTVYLMDDVFGVCTRNLDLERNEDNSLWKLALSLGLEEKLRKIGSNIALQGEIYGESIQKNKLKKKGHHFALFNVYNIDTEQYFNYEGLIGMAKLLKIETVPILTDSHIISDSIQEYVEMSKIRSTICPEVWAEGIVIRPLTERSFTGERVSFKSINPNFLLKYEE